MKYEQQNSQLEQHCFVNFKDKNLCKFKCSMYVRSCILITRFWSLTIGCATSELGQNIHSGVRCKVGIIVAYKLTITLHSIFDKLVPMGKRVLVALCVCVCERVSEWASEWVSEWMSEWVSEWVSECRCRTREQTVNCASLSLSLYANQLNSSANDVSNTELTKLTCHFWCANKMTHTNMYYWH